MTSLDDSQQYSLNALLYDAVDTRNLDRVKLCLSRGAQAGPANMGAYFNARGEDTIPLAHLAYSKYSAPVLDALAAGGLDVDARDDDGYTALARAVEYQRLECVDHFLKIGASPLSATNAGKTVLDLARENLGMGGHDKREKIIDALLNAVPAPAFNDAAQKKTSVATEEAITINKPISLTTPHKKEGFQL